MKKLLLILLFATFIRLFNLTEVPAGLYWDEFDVGYQAYSLLKTGRDYFASPLPIFPHSYAEYRTPVFIYSAVPFVQILDLTVLSMRLPAVIWGILSVITVYLLANQLLPKASLFAAAAMAISPWNYTYSRISFEVIVLVTLLTLATALYFRALKSPKYLLFSSFFFGLTLYSYSTAKFFVPVFCFILILTYKRSLARISRKQLFASFVVLIIFATPLYYDSVFGKSAGRFHNVSIFTDPVIGTTVNQERFESTISRLDGTPQVGLSPSLLDKFLSNRPVLILKAFTTNYLSAFSSNFLFLTGDPLQRHSPDKSWFGQLNILDIIPLLLGLTLLKSRKLRIIGIWLLLAPLPSAITRDGGTHASRLILMLPPLILIIALGFKKLYSYNKLLFLLYTFAYFICFVYFQGFYLTRYKLQSAMDFNWGFAQIISEAEQLKSKYDLIFIDTRNESALMAYLVTAKVSPSEFQSLQPLAQKEFSDGFSGYQFGNVVILDRGTRHWTNSKIKGNNLVISTADQPLITEINPKIKTINYPDQTPAFYFFLSSLSNPSTRTPK